MNRKKNFLLILFVLVLSFVMAFSLVACKRDTGKKVVVDDEKALLTNGNFITAEGEYPKSPASWDGAPGSSDSNKGTPNKVGQDLVYGVIDVSNEVYDEHAEEWKLAKNANPKAVGKDNHVLMINNLKKTAYKYSTSRGVTIDKDGYYEVTINVKVSSEATAYIRVTGDAYAEFKVNNTNGKWMPYKVYIQGSNIANKSINITLANGWGDKTEGMLSKGQVFFDDIKVVKLEDSKKYDEAIKSDSSAIKTYSMIQSDNHFMYVNPPYTPMMYRGYVGYSESGNNANSGSSYVSAGILNSNIDKNVRTELGLGDIELSTSTGKQSNMLFINNKKLNAYGYRSRVPFLVEAGHTYSFKAVVRTTNLTLNDATLRIVDNSNGVPMTGDKKDDFEFKINTNGDWMAYEFIIEGDNLTDKEIYFDLWLGEGGVNHKENWASGSVFMDGYTFSDITNSNSQASLASEIPTNTKHPSFATPISTENNDVEFGYIMKDADTNNGWNTMPEYVKGDDNKIDNSAYASHKVIAADEKLLPAKDIKIKTSADAEETLNRVVRISINEPSAYGFIIDNSNNGGKKLMVEKNSYYKFSMWVKTDLDKEYVTKGLNIRLMQKAEKEDEKDSKIVSFDNINTTSVETNNGYVNVVFYIEGSHDKDTEIFVDVTLGSGTKYTPETFVKGNAYIALVGMEEINHNDYIKASSSTYTKKNSLVKDKSETTNSVPNTNFSNSDINATYTNYLGSQAKDFKDLPYEEKLATFLNENGEFIMPTVPTSWSLSERNYFEALTTGIVNNQLQADKIKERNNNITNFDLGTFDDKGSNSSLVIATKDTGDKGSLTVPTPPEVCGCTCEECIKNGVCKGDCKDPNCNCLHKRNALYPVGYESGSISLNANSYYMINVKVKVGSLNGKTGSSAYVYVGNDYVEVRDTAITDWQDVTFYISTGLSGTSIKIGLYLGQKDTKMLVSGAVAFDNVVVSELPNKDYFENHPHQELSKVIPLVTDEFDINNPSTDKMDQPTGWSGSVSGSAKSENTTAGVFDKNNTQKSWLKTITTDDKGNTVTNELDIETFNYLTNKTFENNDPEVTEIRYNKNFLTINNTVANAYKYVSSSKSFAANNYYKVSVDLLTYGLKADETAYITLTLRSNATYTMDKDEKVKLNTSTYENGKEQIGSWTTYTFYVKTPKTKAISNATLTLGLGKSSDNKDKKDENFVQGYAFFDSVTFEEAFVKDENGEAIEDREAEFNKIKNNATTKTITITDDDMLAPEKDETPKTDEEKKEGNNLMWLYITSGVIGGLIIIVVIGVLLKKFWPRISAAFNKNKAKNLSEYDKNSPKTEDKKNRKKSNKEFKD